MKLGWHRSPLPGVESGYSAMILLLRYGGGLHFYVVVNLFSFLYLYENLVCSSAQAILDYKKK